MPRARIQGLVAACCVTLVVSSRPAFGRDDESFVGTFHVTYYHVAVEDSRYLGLARDQILEDRYGCELARVSSAYRRKLDLEGTGRLADGRVINVAARAEDGWRYVDLGPAHWGLGADGIPLVPFFSVAADPDKLPCGARLFLPDFQGFRLPDGSEHGGRFIVDDVGSAIVHDRLDIFLGDVSALARFESVVPSHGPTPVYRFGELTQPVNPAVDLLRVAP